jgi:hypothetical protein
MNINFRNLLAILSVTIFQSCVSDVKPIQPEYKKPLQSLIADVSKLTAITNFNISSIKKSSSNANPTNELKIELTNAAVVTYTTDDLDSLSKNVVRIMNGHISNLNSFDWISVWYIRNDGFPVSDSSQQYVYVYRPTDIK